MRMKYSIYFPALCLIKAILIKVYSKCHLKSSFKGQATVKHHDSLEYSRTPCGWRQSKSLVENSMRCKCYDFNLECVERQILPQAEPTTEARRWKAMAEKAVQVKTLKDLDEPRTSNYRAVMKFIIYTINSRIDPFHTPQEVAGQYTSSISTHDITIHPFDTLTEALKQRPISTWFETG